jgi:hypothetical protein
MGSGFIENLRIAASKDYVPTVLYSSEITIGHTRSIYSVMVFNSRHLAAAFNGGHSPSSGFSNCPRPQLLVWQSSISQTQNPSHHLPLLLTHSLTMSRSRSRSKSKSYYNRRSVVQSVLVSRHPSGTRDPILFLLI